MHPNSPRSGCRRALKARHEWCQFATLPPARAVVYERFTTGRAARSQKRMGLMDGGGRQLIQKSRLHGISTQARTGISTEARHDQSIHDGAIYSGDTALDGSRHEDISGNSRTGVDK